MKKNFGQMKCSGLLMFAIMLLCSLFGITGVEAMHAEGGTITYGEPVSLDYALENAPEIVKAAIDREVVVIKPHLTPLYTLGAKHAHTKNVKSPIIQYDEVEMQPLTTTVATAYTAGTSLTQTTIDLTDNALVAINETLYFKGIVGYLEDGTTPDGGWFVGVIKDRYSDGKPIVKAINGPKNGTTMNTVPAIAATTVVVRGARTGSEKQSRTAPLAVVPTQKENYMQKMLIETEETTMFELAATLGDVKWNKSDITDFAIAEHKMTTEADILLGKKRMLKIANKYNQDKDELTFFQEGIYWQAGRDHSMPTSSVKADLIALMKKIFVGNQSSNTKIAFLGSDVIETINKVDFDQVIYPGKPGQAFGLDVQRIIYGQYTLMLVAEPAFDDLKMPGYGLILDETYLYKYTGGWRSIALDNLKNGQSDSTSQVFIESFCYVLKNKNAHCRVKLV
jgi:hypothetical protein